MALKKVKIKELRECFEERWAEKEGLMYLASFVEKHPLLHASIVKLYIRGEEGDPYEGLKKSDRLDMSRFLDKIEKILFDTVAAAQESEALEQKAAALLEKYPNFLNKKSSLVAMYEYGLLLNEKEGAYIKKCVEKDETVDPKGFINMPLEALEVLEVRLGRLYGFNQKQAGQIAQYIKHTEQPSLGQKEDLLSERFLVECLGEKQTDENLMALLRTVSLYAEVIRSAEKVDYDDSCMISTLFMYEQHILDRHFNATAYEGPVEEANKRACSFIGNVNKFMPLVNAADAYRYWDVLSTYLTRLCMEMQLPYMGDDEHNAMLTEKELNEPELSHEEWLKKIEQDYSQGNVERIDEIRGEFSGKNSKIEKYVQFLQDDIADEETQWKAAYVYTIGVCYRRHELLSSIQDDTDEEWNYLLERNKINRSRANCYFVSEMGLITHKDPLDLIKMYEKLETASRSIEEKPLPQ